LLIFWCYFENIIKNGLEIMWKELESFHFFDFANFLVDLGCALRVYRSKGKVF